MAKDLQAQLRQALPGHAVNVEERNGELHVTTRREYSLTISDPDRPISIENIVARARGV